MCLIAHNQTIAFTKLYKIQHIPIVAYAIEAIPKLDDAAST